MSMPIVLTGFAAAGHAAAFTTGISPVANVAKAPTQKPAAKPEPRRFVVGQVYATRSVCDYDCIFRWYVVKRTDKSVWIRSVRSNGDGSYTPYGGVTRRAISRNYGGDAELIYPSGKYSMCPILTADKGDI